MTNSICVQCKTPQSETCIYHPGKPIFHDGLKGYECCGKRVTDFDDFLRIEGCCVGEHKATETKEQQDIKVTSETENLILKKEVRKDKKPAGNVLIPTVMQIKRNLEIQNDPEGFQPVNGMNCQRLGCQHSYDSKEESECNFHKGVPIFHEGSKGYSCCRRKVLEFDEFMKIEGCTTGGHMYTKAIKPARHDWYQSLHEVHVSVFAKNVDKAACKVEFTPTSVTLTAPGVYFHQDLFQEISVEESKFVILKPKVEVTLKKKTGMSWPSLEAGSDQQSFTTFGTNGGGTIGGNEIKIAAPTIARQ